jgi:biotin carboxylase
VNITDKEAVFRLARELRIDGIMSFAVDPGVVTAAYVADKLGIPTCPYESVLILQNKALFRQFLAKHNFFVPTAKGFMNETVSEDDLSQFHFPVIVKPVDSAGSKGVTKVESKEELEHAISKALSNSFSGQFIIEDFIEQKGFSSDTDSFSVNGEMKFYSFSNQCFDKNAKNPYTPSAISWPSTISDKNQDILKSELQRLIDLLNLGTSIYNIEVRVGMDGKAYIMEMSPRGGGNRLSEMVKYATGVDLITNAVKAAVGIDSLDVTQRPYNGHWAIIILHANMNGCFIRVDIDINKKHIIELDLWVKPGDRVSKFIAASAAIGTLIVQFENQEQLEKMMESQDSWLNVIVE